jgi:hypothetical protein
MTNSEYQKRQEGSGTVFEVTPATAPKNAFGVVGGLIVMVVFGFLFYSFSHPAGIFFMCIGGLFVWLGWSLDRRPKAHKSKATFRVTPSAIETSGRTFNKEDIHRLIVKNGMSDKITMASYSLVNVAGTSTGAGVAAGAQWLEKVSKVANSLDVETGGKAYALAGGMDETTAFGLLQDVSKVIGFTT